ncbi:MAG: glutathione synthetase [Actinomycetaceae bacterium]|nr:glutathione synthetase [Arcanobacterium sp.]MDD7687551.1 glutathione synthetase [Actinomycetaceae bacterium]MDY5273025.1 glutathione synthetase [Arcanobacterium sp.]
MSAPVVTLATSAQFPNLDADEAGLPDALRDRGMEPRIAIWDDPSVNWDDAGVVVVRSVRDYARDSEAFIRWARSVPRILNSAGTMAWNTDKHYLAALERLGLPVIPTIWLEPDQHLSKHQIHTRFPSLGDFVVKPAISSGGRGTGRYTATDASSRSDAVEHARYELSQGRTVMVQRYLDVIDRTGETSLIYFNGMPAYTVEKEPMLHPRFNTVANSDVVEEQVLRSVKAGGEAWRWGEQIRVAIHRHIKDVIGRDELLLFNRVDIVRGDERSDSEFYVMEVSLIDGSLYLGTDEEHLALFADAIQMRVLS